MAKFDYDDRVRVVKQLSARLGSPASVIGVFETRSGMHFDQFPPGVVYAIEFDDGEAIDAHESWLEGAG